MKAHFMASVVLLLGWLALLLPAPAQGREIKPRQKWSGRLEKSLESQHPLKKNHLASQGELEHRGSSGGHLHLQRHNP